jgi:hypothetical protein
MITGSSLQRVMACPASETLTHVHSTNEFAEAGNARHLYLQHVEKVGMDAALDMVPAEYRGMCEAIDLDGLPTNLATEVAFAWNWQTGEARELGRGLDRDYSSCGPHEVAGTIDALGVAEDSVYLGDYKGFQPVAAKDNAQLLFAAMCSAKVYAKDAAILEIINIRHGSNWRSNAGVDVFDLADFETRLRHTMISVAALQAGQRASFNEGEHCRYCPGFQSCPAKTALIRAMVNGDEATRVEMTVPLSPETATLAYQQLRAMEALVKRARDIVYAYASERPIQLGDGRVFGSRVKPGNERLDGDVVYGVLRNHLGQSAADVAVERKATKAGIARAVKHAKTQGTATGTLKAITGAIMENVESNGGVTRRPTTTIDEHRAELTP